MKHAAVSSLFSAMAQVRRAPAVHPQRLGFAGRLEITTDNPLLPLGVFPADVQLSKGAGTPGSSPDVLGVALRVRLAGAPWDFLFSSAGHGRLTRWLPIPASDWAAARYGTLAPYDVGGERRWLMLTPDGPRTGHASIDALRKHSPSAFTLSAASAAPRWWPIGQLEVFSPSTELLTFDPIVNHSENAHPAPAWLRRLRELAYQGSRRGRRTTDAEW
ncbi:hypothetical protein [Kribbella sp. NPDC051770]|uniref:hypothetical protein n=1 Tax=Kribbella sp. NPDC051770 TaxID=3155413 RepID=UPI00342BA884